MTEQATSAEKRPRLWIPKFLADQERRPDRSREGFDAAVKAAIEFCALYEYASLKGMQDDIHLVMSERLRVDKIELEFVAWHHATGRPRMSIRVGRFEAREDMTVKFGPASGKAN